MDEPILLLFVLLRKEESYEYQRMESKMGIGRDPSYRDCCHGFVDAFLKIIGPIQCFFRIMPFLCKEKGHFL